jgi:membrane protein
MISITRSARGTLGLLKESWDDFGKDECQRLAAALSYYTVFSLPPLLVVLIAVAGIVWDANEVRGAIETQMTGLLGQEGGAQVGEIIRSADRPDVNKPLAALIGIGALLFGATGAFMALQGALNRAWSVQPDPAQGGIRNFITKRILSLGMILVVAFLVLVSLALSAALAAAGDTVGRAATGVPAVALEVLTFVVSFAVVSGLFAAIYKVLPDAKIAWRDTIVGSVFTAFLFVLGKFLLGFYLGRNDPGSAFGAAGSLALMLVWIYYASMIVLFGAEFTEAWSRRYGKGIVPEEGAVKVEIKTQRVETGPKARPKADPKASPNAGTELQK